MDEANEVHAICQSITAYAATYRDLQEWQTKSRMIPTGDQKTGCIGEFYCYLYLNHAYQDATLIFGSHSEKGWDIEVRQTGKQVFRVQVKTVSAYSATRVISPIHHGWDQLFLIFLDKTFQPTGFWIIKDNSIIGEKEIWKNCRCRDPHNADSGSTSLPFGENLVASLQTAIAEAKLPSEADPGTNQT